MAISTSSILGVTGFTFFTLYILSQILDFYGVTSSVYGYYLAFYGFLAISMLVLPTTYATLSEPSEVKITSSNITENVIKPSAPPLPIVPVQGKVVGITYPTQGTPAIPVSQINIL
jgi:hypothetical protein